jgi:hypothetical protein
MQLPEVKLKMDYKSTSRTVKAGDPAPNPNVPDGEGWRLKTSGHVAIQGGANIKYSWTWEREIPETQSDEGEYLTQELRSPR